MNPLTSTFFLDVPALPRFLPPQDAPELSAAAIECAEDRVMADMEDFTDELSANCFHRSNVDSDRAIRVPGRLEAADDATVLHAALTAGLRGDAETACAAMRILAQRHLDRNTKRVLQLAGEAE